jgi:hypothetical protein
MHDVCPEPGKIEALKMLDLQTKSAIDSICFRVQLQATSHYFLTRKPESISCVSCLNLPPT